MELLDAVNEMLHLVGAESVDSIESTHPQAEAAIEHLNAASKRVQRKGWWFNTVYGKLLAEGTPVKVILQIRGIQYLKGKFINTATQEELPNTTPIHYAIYLQEWANIPEVAQDVILHVAMKYFVRDELEDPAKEANIDRLIGGAMVLLQEEHLAQEKINAFKNPQVAHVLHRVAPNRWK